MERMNRRQAMQALGVAGLALPGSGSGSPSPAALDADRLLSGFYGYWCALHQIGADPAAVVQTHHYCSPIGDEIHQCIVFDANHSSARILGVEYLISDRLYRTLPESEQRYYHSHRNEVLQGAIEAPTLPPEQAKQLLAALANSWGKAWCTWPDPATALPLGEPRLMLPPASKEAILLARERCQPHE